MIPVFIGMDYAEELAVLVCASSIIRRTKEPVSICPIGNDTLPKRIWKRQRGPHDSTDFSNARFAVPALMDYKGWAIFMDCDVLVLADIEELWEQRDDRFAVMVVKHNYSPAETTKFLNQPQSTYSRKNWSSLMLLNCGHTYTRDLTVKYINSAPGLDLHGLVWAPDPFIGEITGQWNVLATGPATVEHPECETA